MKTNVYVANYEDLSQLSVNAENLQTAVQEFAQIKNDEPMLLQRKITGIQIPDPPEPKPIAILFCRAEREEESETLPDTVTVRPSAIERHPGDTVMLYAIDTATAPIVEFAGWYNSAGLRISTDANFAFTVPDVSSSGETIELVAKFRTKVVPATYNISVKTEMSNSGVVPDSCVVRPTGTTQVEEGSSVTLYAIVTDPAYKFVSWKSESGDVLSNEATFVYTPTESGELIAIFSEV